MPLAEFQREGVARAWAILERRGGAIVADSVGLGKTFTALGLVERALLAGRSVLVIMPAALRRMWRTELQRLASGNRVQVLSHTQLARGRAPPEGSADFIVVDEAHAFRNPSTRRYRALRRLGQRAPMVLLTATPINNSLWDLYFQLRLWCADGAFRDLGIGSLRDAFRDGRDIDRVLRAVVVRRTRAEVRASGGDLAFPAVTTLRTVSYELPLPVADMGRMLERLCFPGHEIVNPELLRYSLLKRMESSVAAIQASLGRQARYYEELLAAVENGRTLTPRLFRSLFAGDAAAIQLVLGAVTFEPLRTDPRTLQRAIATELEVLREWRGLLRPAEDDKLARLAGILRERAGRKTIVFSEYRDTARYLWSKLRGRFATALIDGAGARIGDGLVSRRYVVERFAPLANGVRPAHAREAIDVLVATDVLAEGLNLQDADAVISYDLPWNPIRLVQRAGRVDRIGSPHGSIEVYNFMPDREFDAFLGLVRRIRAKLETVRSSVGLERPVLEADEVITRLRTGSYDIINEIEGSGEVALRNACGTGTGTGPGSGKCEGIPVGVAPGATGDRVLIGLSRPPDWDVIALDLQAGPAVVQTDTDAILLRAVNEQGVAASLPTRLVGMVEAFLFDWNRRAPPLHPRGPAALVARRVQAELRTHVRQADAETFARADLVLERLSRVRLRSAESQLEAIAAQPFDTLTHLLEAIEAATETAGQFVEEWQVTGVLVAD